MDLRVLTSKQKNIYNQKVSHIVQSWQWGDFRQKMGLQVLRFGFYEKDKLITAFQLDLHYLPFLQQQIGYLPKGPFPDSQLAEALKRVGQENNCVAIKIEPNIFREELISSKREPSPLFLPSLKSNFTRYNFILDLRLPEDALIKNMHPKTRYNIKIAQKHGVWVEERTDDEALAIHLKLYFATSKRQGYSGHNEHYHKTMWQILNQSKMAKILIAFYTPPGTSEKIPLASWVLFNFHDTLYYPYGGSSPEYKNVMASTFLAWQAICYGKKLGLKKFDLWGASEPNVSKKDPYYGFTKFKEGLGAQRVEYLGTYDLVFHPLLFSLFNIIDKSIKVKILLLWLLRR